MNHLKPTELFLGIESGFYSVEEVVAWADSYILNHEYDDGVADISMSSGKSSKEVYSLLQEFVKDDCRVPAMRAVLGRMSEALERDESLAHHIAQYCERFWIAQDYELPDDMQFMVAAEDEFYLAAQGIYGNKTDAVETLKKDLRKFRKYAEQDNGASSL